MKSGRGHVRVLPFVVRWNAETALFDVYLDGHLVGSHRGRGTADKIGMAAVEARRLAQRQAAKTG